MNEIKVSVIIPVYNSEKHLAQCLDSVIDQTLKDIEIICVNDGSQDSSLEILNQYAQKDERIKVITQENGGAGKARNTGLREAQGKYLSFLDSDDFSEPEMLEKAYLKAEEGKADMVVFKSDQYYEDEDVFRQVTWTLREKELPPYRPMYFRTFTDNVFKVFVGWAWDKLFLRQFVLDNDLTFQEIRTTNDMRFVFMATVLARRIETVMDVLIHQRRNQKDSLSNTREKSWDCFHTALVSLKDELVRHGYYEELKQDYINYVLHASLWNITTITGEKREVLFNKLKNEWFEELGVKGKEDAYFYNKTELRQYKEIMDNDYLEWEKLVSR